MWHVVAPMEATRSMHVIGKRGEKQTVVEFGEDKAPPETLVRPISRFTDLHVCD